MNTNNNKVMLIFVSILAVVAIALAAVLVVMKKNGNTAADEPAVTTKQRAEQEKTADHNADPIETAANTASTQDYDNRKIDFAALKSSNPHVCAWISVPGTNIDCAVVCDDDDPEYYLTNDIEGMDAVFMQSYNSTDFSDRMSVIYGKKNAQDKSEFEGLFSFQDSDFYKENKYIYLYIENDVKKYRIFAAHRAVAEHLMLGYDWNVDQIYLDYLIGVLNSNGLNDNIDKDVEITVDDRVLTLSERVSDDENTRFLVQGVLER